MKHAEDYVIDVQYVYNFWSQHTPLHLDFTAFMNGYAVPSRESFHYLELGCGQGYALCLQAAAYPEGQFYGVDMNPAHIKNCQDMVEKSALENVTLIEDTFSGLLDKINNLPLMDYICLHGVYTWVNDEGRNNIADIIKKLLKPGGLAYISYNALPGNTGTIALQHLIMEKALSSDGASDALGMEALNLAIRMGEAGAAFFKRFPMTIERAKSSREKSPQYVAHEFLNKEWRALPFSAVCRSMQKADLEFVGMASNYQYKQEDWKLPRELAKIIWSEEDPIFRNTLLDYAVSTSFRTDVYIRDGKKLSSEEFQKEFLGKSLVFIIEANLFESCTANNNINKAFVKAVAPVIQNGPVKIGQLHELSKGLIEEAEFRGAILAWLSGSVAFLVKDIQTDPAPSARFNRMVSLENPFGKRFSHTASPVTGTGITVPHKTLVSLEVQEKFGSVSETDRIEIGLKLLEERKQPLARIAMSEAYPVLARREMASSAYGFETMVLPLLTLAGISLGYEREPR